MSLFATTNVPCPACGKQVAFNTVHSVNAVGRPDLREAIIKGTLDIEIIDLPVWTHNGTLTLTGTQIRILWTFSGDECIFDAGHTGVLTGGAMATIDWAGTLTKTAGNLGCPEGNATWNGAYTVTTPEPLWVSM